MKRSATTDKWINIGEQ